VVFVNLPRLEYSPQWFDPSRSGVAGRVRNRRVFLVAARSSEGLLIESRSRRSASGAGTGLLPLSFAGHRSVSLTRIPRMKVQIGAPSRPFLDNIQAVTGDRMGQRWRTQRVKL
jgi:hypothetical protein